MTKRTALGSATSMQAVYFSWLARSQSSRGLHGGFTSREAAEEFIQGDPFVVNGIVASWTLRGWDEVLSK